MITKLTKEQKARCPEFVERWTQIGLSTEPIDKKRVESALDELFGQVKKRSPAKLVYCTSPLSLVLTLSVLRSANVLDNVRDNVSDNVSDNVRANVSDNVSDNVLANVRDNVSDNVLANVRDNVLANVRDNVLANVSTNVLANVSANVSANVLNNVSDLVGYWYYDFGQFAASWLSFWSYLEEVLAQDVSPLKGNFQFCKESGSSALFWEFAFVGHRPIAIHRNANNLLHKDEGLAVEYQDGWGVYALNGIRMSADYVLSPSEKLDPSVVLAESNVDIRRELIRKIGVERMLTKLPHKILDKRGDYEVLSVELSPTVRDARYLKMLNPSIGTWHIEGEPPEINTVEKALNRRNSQWFTDAEILT